MRWLSWCGRRVKRYVAKRIAGAALLSALGLEKEAHRLATQHEPGAAGCVGHAELHDPGTPCGRRLVARAADLAWTHGLRGDDATHLEAARRP
jgi:hypothetical protein